MSSETKTCQNCKNQFTIEPEDFDFYRKISVPPPTWCPECRIRRRFSWRNERTLYKRTCALCSQPAISAYSPDQPFIVYCRDCWWSDKWNPASYGRDYDWSKPFFVQFRELMEVVPRLHLQGYGTNINSDYSNYKKDNKNVYHCFSITTSEDCFYSRGVDKGKNLFDCLFVTQGENSYESVDSSRIYNSKYLVRSHDCLDSWFLYDCVGCQNCFMSSNARNKKFLFKNKQLSKEEYSNRIAEIALDDYKTLTGLKSEFNQLIKKSLNKFANILKSTSVTGDNIENARNCQLVFDAYELENVKHSSRVFSAKDTYDVFGLAGGELIYEGINVGATSSKVRFGMNTDPAGRDSIYVDLNTSDSNLFGCIGLRSKQYCILNKQYTKEEYEAILPKIIQHMNDMPYVDARGRVYKYGEFFPPELSPFAYNETIAQEYFPLTKEEAEERGYGWREPEGRHYEITKKPEDLPDHIKDVDDSILKETIQCAHYDFGSPSTGSGQIGKPICNEQCTTAFKIIESELQFYRKMNLPLPRLCPNCRHYQRLKQRNPLKLWHRRCTCAGEKSENGIYKNTTAHFHGAGKCPNEFETSYAPERPEIVYCESCYNNEVV